jgi:hypothetical protein
MDLQLIFFQHLWLMFFTSSVRCNSVRETELLMTCSVRFGQNSKTLLWSVTNSMNQILMMVSRNTKEHLYGKAYISSSFFEKAKKGSARMPKWYWN